LFLRLVSKALGHTLNKGIHDSRYRKLIDALRDARREAGFSQTAFAARLGRRQQFVSKYESGERRLDVVEFTDIATALRIDWAALLHACLSGDQAH
jgi:transcriptional regulator with XRE-family HTH domain